MKFSDKHDIGPEIAWIAASWAISLVALCAFACKGTDLAPDEFTATAGHSEGGIDGYRHDMDSDYGEFGLTWYIGGTERHENARRYEEWLWAKPDRQISEKSSDDLPITSAPEPTHVIASPEQPPSAAAEPAPAPKPVTWAVVLPYLPALALGLLAALTGKKPA